MKMLRSLLPLLAASLLPALAHAEGKVAEPYAAPDIEAVDQDGKAVKLAEVYKSSPYVVVYFYPKADTPGCTKQGCSLRDAFPELTKAGVKVIGVSADGAEAQKKFSDKYKFPFTLLADADGKVIQAFKVKQRGNGMASRECFLIKDGKVVWHDPSASTEGQAQDVLKAIEETK